MFYDLKIVMFLFIYLRGRPAFSTELFKEKLGVFHLSHENLKLTVKDSLKRLGRCLLGSTYTRIGTIQR